MKAVSFTGHRPEKLGGYDKNDPKNQKVIEFLGVAVKRLQGEGYEEFISGGALGVDQWAAQVVLDLGAKLTLALPFAAYGENWPAESQKVLEDLKAKATKVVIVCEGGYFENGKPQHWKNHKRNQWMADNAEVCVAIYNGDEKGGTASGVRCNKKLKRRIIRWNPNTEKEEPVE